MNEKLTNFRRHLIVFSLAAPCMGILTYLSLTIHGRQNMDTLSATGESLLLHLIFIKYFFRVKKEYEIKNKVSYSPIPSLNFFFWKNGSYYSRTKLIVIDKCSIDKEEHQLILKITYILEIVVSYGDGGFKLFVVWIFLT